MYMVCDFRQKMSDSEESLPSDIENSAQNVVSSLLPQKSKATYEMTFNRYEEWCIKKKVKNITNEKVLLAYFEELAKNRKSSSLWSYYSMLRSVLSIKKNIDISKYIHLVAFLKRKSEGYRAKKSRIFTKEDIAKFLLDADDKQFLMIKVKKSIKIIFFSII